MQILVGELFIQTDAASRRGMTSPSFAIETNQDWPVSPDGMSVTFEVDDFEAALRHLRDHDIVIHKRK